MSEAIADVKGKAKDSLDELCSMVETLLNEKEEKKEAAIRKLREMRQNYLDLRAKRTTLRKKYQALLVLYNELLATKNEEGKEASDSSSSSESESNDDDCCIM